ncbi:MAG: hypothetical protein RRY40_04680, partial [Oscillospiraceae bacterium]
MQTAILTLENNISSKRLLAHRIQEVGLLEVNDYSFADKNESFSLKFMTALQQSDIIIVSAPQKYSKAICENLQVKQRASKKAIEYIESYCRETGENPVLYSERVLIPHGGAILSGENGNVGYILIVEGKFVVFLTEDTDEVQLHTLCGILKGIVGENSGEKGKSPQRTMGKNMGIFLICGALMLFLTGISLAFKFNEDADEPAPSLPVTSESALTLEEELEKAKKEAEAEGAYIFLGEEESEEPSKREPPKAEPVKAEPSKPTPPKAEVSKPEPPKAEPSKSEPPKTEPSKPQPSKPPPPKAPVKPESSAAEEYIYEMTEAELKADREFEQELEKEQKELEAAEKKRQEEAEKKKQEQENEKQEAEENPPDVTDETIFVKVNGKTKEMNAYDLILQAVQNETHGLMEPEALKAQAVAAYSFFKYNNKNGVYPAVSLQTTISQSTKKAVDAVFGRACYHNGKIINAVYHST